MVFEKESNPLKQLFQDEFSKMVSVISKYYGLQYIETAEDIVSETFLQAAEDWGVKGMPQNPAAWLYAVAKQKTLYHFRRNKIFEDKVIPEITSVRGKEDTYSEPDFSEQNIKDSQLQMLFAICHPGIASEAQIGLALRILCGFGIDEIAEAFLVGKETINKRLFRAKEKLRKEKVTMISITSGILSETEIATRLDNVLRIIYLLFNEGYYSVTQNQILRKELCLEAMRLGIMLTEYEITNHPQTNALMALMCFHASRFEARQTPQNGFILYEEQDEDLWDASLIDRGVYFLNGSAQGVEISSYHLEARIAFWHCIKEDTRKKWENILETYDLLLQVNYSPSAFLNRIYALYKLKGAREAISETKKLKLENNHFYYILLSELYKGENREKAKEYLQKAYDLAKTQPEKQDIQNKIDRL